MQQHRRHGCVFCERGAAPDYKHWDDLKAFVTERARIISRGRSSVCAKHQRLLAREVKRARHLALLPFAVHV